MSILADQVQLGQVVQAADGTVYQLISRDGGAPVWGSIQPVPFFGPPFNPEGELTLLQPAQC